MRKFLIQSLVGSGLALSAFTLGAQQYNPQQYPPQGNYNRPDRENGRNFLLNRVRTDLDMAQSSAFGQDRWKLRRAKESLNDFQARLNSGDYDRRGLDVAIANVQQVVDSNRLPYRMQRNLSDDVNRLRTMQYRMSGGL